MYSAAPRLRSLNPRFLCFPHFFHVLHVRGCVYSNSSIWMTEWVGTPSPSSSMLSFPPPRSHRDVEALWAWASPSLQWPRRLSTLPSGLAWASRGTIVWCDVCKRSRPLSTLSLWIYLQGYWELSNDHTTWTTQSVSTNCLTSSTLHVLWDLGCTYSHIFGNSWWANSSLSMPTPWDLLPQLSWSPQRLLVKLRCSLGLATRPAVSWFLYLSGTSRSFPIHFDALEEPCENTPNAKSTLSSSTIHYLQSTLAQSTSPSGGNTATDAPDRRAAASATVHCRPPSRLAPAACLRPPRRRTVRLPLGALHSPTCTPPWAAPLAWRPRQPQLPCRPHSLLGPSHYHARGRHLQRRRISARLRLGRRVGIMGWSDGNGKGGKTQDYNGNGHGSGGFMWNKIKELTDFTAEIKKEKDDDKQNRRSSRTPSKLCKRTSAPSSRASSRVLAPRVRARAPAPTAVVDGSSRKL